MRGPDHKASLEPAQFAEQVRALREVELSIGVPQRWITRGETLNRRVLGKSLVAATDIPAHTTDRPQHADEQESRTGTLAAVRRQARRPPALAADRRATRCSASRTSKTPWRAATRPPSTSARHGASSRASSISRRSSRPSCRSACASSSSTSATAIWMPARRRYQGGRKPFGFVVHAPEYCHDTLIDLCSADDAQRALSVQRIQKTIDLARDLAPLFQWDRGAVSRRARRSSCTSAACRRGPGATISRPRPTGCWARCGGWTRAGVDLLLENLPPYPWYFGGRWFGHVLCDPENTVRLCRESGLGLCFDTSHAALECARSGASLLEFARAVAPYVRHLHMSDGAGTSGEGLQIGDGSVNFVALLPVLLESQPTVIPEIWMGHHENGARVPRRARASDRNPLGQHGPRPAERSPHAAGPPRAHRHGRRDDLHRAARDRHQPDGHRLRPRRHAGASSAWSRTATSATRSSAASIFTTTSAQAMTRDVRPWRDRHVAAGTARAAAGPHAGDADPRCRRPPRRLRQHRHAGTRSHDA